jgi:hypothetical protein
MSRKSKTENTPSRESASSASAGDQGTAPGVGESHDQAGNVAPQDANDSSAPGQDIPAQGAATGRYRFTWTEHGRPTGGETGHDHPQVAYDAVHRGCDVFDHQHGTPYVEQLKLQGVLPKDFVVSHQS